MQYQVPENVRLAEHIDSKNAASIFEVRFYIRGKLWVVSVDEYMLFCGTQPPLSFKFSKQSHDDLAIWGPVLEKAWAKVKGSCQFALLGDIHTLTSVLDFYGCKNINSFESQSKKRTLD